MHNENQTIEQRYKGLFLIWLALLISQIMFLVVLYFAKPSVFSFDFSKPLIDDNTPLIFAFAFFALMNLVISFVVKKNLLESAIEHQNPGLVQTALVIACGLAESSSVFGLITAFVFDFQYFPVFFAIGLLGTFLHMPKRENLHAASYKNSADDKR